MPAPLSSHIPGLSGATETITGSLTIDTGLRTLQSFTATLKTAIAANEESGIYYTELAQTAGTTVKVTIFVVKGGTASGTAGDSAVDVSWIAIGT